VLEPEAAGTDGMRPTTSDLIAGAVAVAEAATTDATGAASASDWATTPGVKSEPDAVTPATRMVEPTDTAGVRAEPDAWGEDGATVAPPTTTGVELVPDAWGTEAVAEEPPPTLGR